MTGKIILELNIFCVGKLFSIVLSQFTRKEVKHEV